VGFDLIGEGGEGQASHEFNPWILRSYFSMALVLDSFAMELRRLQTMGGIDGVKLHIRQLCKLLFQLQNFSNTMSEYNNHCQKKGIDQYRKMQKDSAGNVILLLRFIDRMTLEVLSLIEHTKLLDDMASVIFAYVLDESTTHICQRHTASRLEQLLAGQPFEPIANTSIQHSYENYRLVTTEASRLQRSFYKSQGELPLAV
jgi:hypothetical protein